MISEHPDFYVPNLYTFQNGNAYLGSFHGLRFRLKPGKREESGTEVPILEALTWHGIYCLELSEVVAEATFPMTEDGHSAMLTWLDDQYHQMLHTQSE